MEMSERQQSTPRTESKSGFRTEYFAPVLRENVERQSFNSVSIHWSVYDGDGKETKLEGNNMIFRVYYWCDSKNKRYQDTHTTKCSIKELQIGSSYSAYVRVMDENKEMSSVSNTIEFFVDLLAPPRLELVEEELRGLDSATIQWSYDSSDPILQKLDGNHIFHIYYWSDSNNMKCVETYAKQYTITKLDLDVSYFAYVVMMHRQHRISHASKTVAFRKDRLAAPTLSETIDRPNRQTAKIHWTLSDDDAQLLRLYGDYVFRAYYWSDPNNKKHAETNATSYSIRKLDLDSSYSACVILMDGAKKLSRPSNAIEFTTAPWPPENIKVEVHEACPHESLTITFDAKQGDGILHEITISSASHDNDDDRKKIEVDQTKVIVNELTPGKLYNITIRTQENNLWSTVSSYGQMALLCPSIPTVHEIELQDNRLVFSWEKLEITPSKYYVQWMESGKKHECESEGESLMIEFPKPATFYSFRVAAENKAGRGFFSDAKIFQTAPAKLKNVRVTKNPRSPQTSLIIRYSDPDPTEKSYRAVALSDKNEEVASGESSSLAIVIHGLRPGNSYKAYVVAICSGKESKRSYCTDLQDDQTGDDDEGI